MKLPVRKTVRIEVAQSLTAPETRLSADKQSRVPLLCWGDESSNQRRDVCTRELFKVVAGENEEGSPPDGLDRLKVDHRFYIHFDANDVAIGLDVIPSRIYGAKLVPTPMVGVTTLKLHFAEDGSGVVRVLQRAVNTRHSAIAAVIHGLDAMSGKSLKVGMKPVTNNAAQIVSLAGGVVEVKMSNKAARESVHETLIS